MVNVDYLIYVPWLSNGVKSDIFCYNFATMESVDNFQLQTPF